MPVRVECHLDLPFGEWQGLVGEQVDCLLRRRAQNGGSFANCTKDALISIEPGLAAAGDRLYVAADARTYEIGVASRRNPRISFTVRKAADGTTARACTTDGEWNGGCRPQFAGTW